jgi:hypothetical protein
MPRTTVPGSTAIVPPIIAEGITTVTFFATDQAGNAEAAQHLMINWTRPRPWRTHRG